MEAPRDVTPHAGLVLAGRYEVGSRIGRGGMATIHLGTDRLLKRTVAVKVLAPPFAEDQRFVARFQREAKAAAGLNHPNVVSVYDTGADDGLHWIVMEHVEGHTLERVLQEEGALPFRPALEIAGDLCRALAAAHARGLIHRDVKPANVMIDTKGRVKVMDFGIARAIDDATTITGTGVVLGTASYLSPEQARGDEVDARSDIYSLGCVLYEMIVGRPPFAGDTTVALAYKHIHEEPVPPSFINQAIPASLEAVVMRAIAKAPSDRYAGAEAMGDAVAEVLRDQSGRRRGVAEQEAGLTDPNPRDTVLLPEAVEPGRRSGRRGRRSRAVALALLAIAGFVGARAVVGPAGMTVPDVKLLPRDRAVDRIEAAGLTATVMTLHRGDVDQGLVVSQSPAPGQEGQLGSNVRIWVSTGPRLVTVPDLIGEEIEDAQALAVEAGLSLERAADLPSSQPFGTILAQFPMPGTDAERGASIGVVLSIGVSDGDDD
jgi:eukaryotic-like serine/threonine-protein kinase